MYFKEVDFPGSLFSPSSVTADGGVVIDSITLDGGLCLCLSKQPKQVNDMVKKKNKQVISSIQLKIDIPPLVITGSVKGKVGNLSEGLSTTGSETTVGAFVSY